MKKHIDLALNELEFNENSLFYQMCQFYNISVKDDNGNFKCLLEIFRELNEAMKDLTSPQNHDII